MDRRTTSRRLWIALALAVPLVTVIVAGGSQAQQGMPQPGKMPPVPVPKTQPFPQPPPSGLPKVQQPPVQGPPVYVTEYSCGKCGKVLGTGAAGQAVLICPGCGARLGAVSYFPKGTGPGGQDNNPGQAGAPDPGQPGPGQPGPGQPGPGQPGINNNPPAGPPPMPAFQNPANNVPQPPVISKVWVCRSCGKQVGSGPTPPSLAQCPHCGSKGGNITNDVNNVGRSLAASGSQAGMGRITVLLIAAGILALLLVFAAGAVTAVVLIYRQGAAKKVGRARR